MKEINFVTRCVFAITGRFCGSGVIIAKLNTPTLAQGQPIGQLGITAGHVLCESLGFPWLGQW